MKALCYSYDRNAIVFSSGTLGTFQSALSVSPSRDFSLPCELFYTSAGCSSALFHTIHNYLQYSRTIQQVFTTATILNKH